MRITTDKRIRAGSAIAYRDGRVAWYGPMDRLPDDRIIDEVAVNPADRDSVERVMQDSEAG